MIVSFEGCIGSGKTTTAQLVGEELGWSRLLGRPLPSWIIARFYANPVDTAFETELGFLLAHYFELTQNVSGDSPHFVLDFAPFRDMVFAQMNLDQESLSVFSQVYFRLIPKAPQPSLTIYLDVPLHELIARIGKRARPYEIGLDVSYLTRLVRTYEENLGSFGGEVRVLTVTEGESRESVAERAIAMIEAHRAST